MRLAARVLTVAIGCACTGCLGYRHAGAGAVTGIGSRARSGPDVAFGLEHGLTLPGPHLQRSPVGFSLGLDGRAGPGFFQASPTVMARLVPAFDRVVPIVGAGVKVFSVEYGATTVSAGLLSPILDAGAFFVIGGGEVSAAGHRAMAGWALLVRGFGGYDIKLSSKPNEVIAGALLGLGYVFTAE